MRSYNTSIRPSYQEGCIPLNKRDAVRLQPGSIILVGYSSRSADGVRCVGKVLKVTAKGGIQISAASYDR